MAESEPGTSSESGGKPSLSISLSAKVQPRQYESSEAFVSIRGVTEDTTEEEMDLLMERGKLAWNKLAHALNAEVARLKTPL